MVDLPAGNCLPYQNEERGLPEVELAFEDLGDPYGIAFWLHSKGRNGAPTPMPWEADSGSVGISYATPWLLVRPEQLALAVSTQEVEGSMLDHDRRALAFRRASIGLRTRARSPMTAVGDMMGLVRTDGGEQILGIANLGDRPVAAALPQDDWLVADPSLSVPVPPTARSVTLGPWQLCLMVQSA